MNEIKDDVKEYVVQRLNGKVYVYIIISFLLVNWSNIIYIMMGSGTVEQRISGINAQDNLYLRFLLFPMACGLIASVLMYAIELIPAFCRMKIDVLSNKIKKVSINGEVDVMKQKEVWEAKRERQISRVKESTKRLSIKTEELIKEEGVLNSTLDVLRGDISNAKGELEDLLAEREEVKKVNVGVLAKGFYVIVLFDSYKRGEINEMSLSDKLDELYMNEGYEDAMEYYAIKIRREGNGFAWKNISENNNS